MFSDTPCLSIRGGEFVGSKLASKAKNALIVFRTHLFVESITGKVP